MSSASRFVGSEVKRLEDPRLIQGQAQYIDDIDLPGLAHAWVVRSPHAHADVLRLDVGAAVKHLGVYGVLTAQDLAGRVHQKPLLAAPPNGKNQVRLPLAERAVKYVGEPVAFVVAADKATARDAADLVQVEYAPLPVVGDPEAALDPGAPQLHPEAPGNLAYEHSWTTGAVETAFKSAHRVVRLRVVNQRLAPLPLEPRGCVAQWRGEALTCWVSTQGPHKVRWLLAETLAVPEHLIQLHGGIAQGVAQALWEGIVYDEAGQLLTATLMDYPAPRADVLPFFELDRTVTPTRMNPLGAKGVGEADCVGAPPAVVNAVLDALAPFGTAELDMPLTAPKVWAAVRAAEATR
jgi:CO/xanthine dehydrogenase Mo-binding subunit